MQSIPGAQVGLPLLPNRAYYQACVGAWTGRVELEITDRAKLRRAHLTPWDRARVWAMVLGSRVLGRARMDTTVTMTSDHEVVHTTRLSTLGLPTLVTREVIDLDLDGARARITTMQRFFPLYWPTRIEGPFDVTIDDAATKATYDLRFLGVPLRQTGEREGNDRVTLVQETEWSRSVQRLVRVL